MLLFLSTLKNFFDNLKQNEALNTIFNFYTENNLFKKQNMDNAKQFYSFIDFLNQTELIEKRETGNYFTIRLSKESQELFILKKIIGDSHKYGGKLIDYLGQNNQHKEIYNFLSDKYKKLYIFEIFFIVLNNKISFEEKVELIDSFRSLDLYSYIVLISEVKNNLNSNTKAKNLSIQFEDFKSKINYFNYTVPNEFEVKETKDLSLIDIRDKSKDWSETKRMSSQAIKNRYCKFHKIKATNINNMNLHHVLEFNSIDRIFSITNINKEELKQLIDNERNIIPLTVEQHSELHKLAQRNTLNRGLLKELNPYIKLEYDKNKDKLYLVHILDKSKKFEIANNLKNNNNKISISQLNKMLDYNQKLIKSVNLNNFVNNYKSCKKPMSIYIST